MRQYKTTSHAYLASIEEVLTNPEYQCSPRDQKILEILNYEIRILNPTSDVIVTKDLERNKIIKDYTKKELDWYMSKSNKVEDAMKISKFWGKLTNPDGETINSNYGHLILDERSEKNEKFSPIVKTPYDWAKDSLLNDKDSRQAIMRVNKPHHAFDGNKDFVCTMYLNFHIRNNELHCTTRMRSSDLYVGVVYDLPFFIYIQETLLADLKVKYTELNIGNFTFSTDSLHIYERNFESMYKMIGK